MDGDMLLCNGQQYGAHQQPVRGTQIDVSTYGRNGSAIGNTEGPSKKLIANFLNLRCPSKMLLDSAPRWIYIVAILERLYVGNENVPVNG